MLYHILVFATLLFLNKFYPGFHFEQNNYSNMIVLLALTTVLSLLMVVGTNVVRVYRKIPEEQPSTANLIEGKNKKPKPSSKSNPKTNYSTSTMQSFGSEDILNRKFRPD